MTIIEFATPGNEAEILLLLERQFAEHHIPYSPETLRAAVSQILADSRLGFFLVARDGGPAEEAVAGTALGLAAVSFAWTLEHGGKSGWLDELYVLPEQRGAGVGGALIEEVVAQTARLGCRAVDLEVETSHHRAEHLYQRKGFRPLDRRRWVRSLNNAPDQGKRD